MQYKTAAIIVAGLAAQQAVADDWQHAGSYSCPGNTNNHCSSHQKGGYDWSGLQPGSFSNYGSNSFHGFSCSNSFGKRDVLGKRGFQSKCITGNLDDGPSMSCGSGDSMSIDQIQVSSSHDADVDCEYGMPDGSTCHQTHSCSEGGSIFQNTQCGGAKSVTFKPGKNAPPGCSIGVHSIGFHCGHASSTVPVYSSSATASSVVVASSSSPASSSAVVSSSAPCYGSGCGGTSSSVVAASSSSPAGSSSLPCYGAGCGGGSASSAPAVGSSSAPCYGSGCGETSSSVSPASSSAPAVGSSSLPCYGSGCGETSSSVSPASSSVPAVGSSSAPCYGAGCSSPGSSSVPAAGSSLPCYGSGCGQSSSSVAAASSVAVGSSTASSPGGYPTPHCPGLLPKCLNTWMYMSHCKDNADSNCFCGNEQFIKNVMGCLEAWGASESETQAAASYLMGLCAPHVTTNPAIITACPSTVKPTPTPAGYTHPHGKPSKPVSPITSKPAGKPAPVTTITYSSTVTVPCTYETGVSKGLTISHSSSETTLVTTVTVPQVHLTTSTVTIAGTTTCSVGLGGGPSPASASAYPTSNAGAASAPAAPTGYGTTLSTGWGAKPTGSSAPIVPATGAGAKLGSGIAGVILGAVAIVAAF